MIPAMKIVLIAHGDFLVVINLKILSFSPVQIYGVPNLHDRLEKVLAYQDESRFCLSAFPP